MKILIPGNTDAAEGFQLVKSRRLTPALPRGFKPALPKNVWNSAIYKMYNAICKIYPILPYSVTLSRKFSHFSGLPILRFRQKLLLLFFRSKIFAKLPLSATFHAFFSFTAVRNFHIHWISILPFSATFSPHFRLKFPLPSSFQYYHFGKKCQHILPPGIAG